MERSISLVFITGQEETEEKPRKGHLTDKGLDDRVKKAEAILRLVFERELSEGFFDLETK